MTWKIYDGSSNEWQQHFKMCKGHYRQSYNWGEYKKLMGWKILRLQKIDSSGNKTLVQVTYKNFLFFSAIYIPGYISGSIELLDANFRRALKKFTYSFFLYIRIDNNSISYVAQNLLISNNGWKRPIHREHTSMTLEIDINRDSSNIIDNIRKNWKKSYKKSVKRYEDSKISFKITNKPNASELILIDRKMNRSRKIYTNHSENEFSFLVNTCSSSVLFIIAYSPNGNPISYRAMIYFDDQGWDLGGATTPEGREALIDYFIMIELLKTASSFNIKKYNLGDIGQEKKMGVHNFKKGLGGKEQIYSGEWEWSNVPFLRLAMNSIIFFLMLNTVRKFFPFINNIRF